MSSKPKVVVIAGPNGAGKSTTAPAIVREALGVEVFVNADTIARGLDAFSPEHVAVAAGRVMVRRIRSLAGEGLSFAFETTLASRSFRPLLSRLRQQGYEFHLIFLWLPTAAMAVERVGIRVKRGGHSVPANVIERRYERGLANFFNLYRPIADSWLMLDNSGEAAPRPIAWRNVGGPQQIVKSGPWITLRGRYEKDAIQ
jgi:predicted ABC-type ATPase